MLIHSKIINLGAFLLRKKRAIRSNLAACIRSRPNSAPIPCVAQKPASLPVFELGEVRRSTPHFAIKPLRVLRYPSGIHAAPLSAIQSLSCPPESGEGAFSAKTAKLKRGRAPFVLLCAALALAACDDPTLGDDSLNRPPVPQSSLTDTVYVGEDGDENWVTFAFTVEDGGPKLFYFPGTPSSTPREGYDGQLACYRAEYTFNQTTGIGEFTVVHTDTTQTPPAVTKDPPIAFSIIDDGLTMTLAEIYPQKEFLRVRDNEAEDELFPPFQFEPLRGGDGRGLAGTVWAGTAYRTKDWTTLTVTGDSGLTSGTIHVTHSFDCTSYPRAYSGYAYNTATSLFYVGPFTVSSNYFIFSDFYGHGGRITLRRMR